MSAGFTPFELLFGTCLWGLLDVAMEMWEEQPSPYCPVVEFVMETHEQIEHVQPIFQEHMHAAQEEQHRTYNWPAHPRKFLPGDWVVLLVPEATYKFLAGPYTIEGWVCLVNY